METAFCQSCGMPMNAEGAQYGREKDGSLNADYCRWCYDEGEFLGNPTMEEMIAFCLPYERKAFPDRSEAEVRAQMQRFFPTLKRWKGEAK